jgi:hypothetical protein
MHYVFLIQIYGAMVDRLVDVTVLGKAPVILDTEYPKTPLPKTPSFIPPINKFIPPKLAVCPIYATAEGAVTCCQNAIQ